MRIECNITQRCNARCDFCNKAVGYADGLLKDMTVDQIRRAVDQLIEQKIRVTRFTFCGGEPCVHTGLQDMIYEVARLNKMKKGRIRVLTNGLPHTQKIRDRIVFPDDRFKWVVNPLDDPSDPYSGKNDPSKRPNKRYHDPFWISPDDIGLHAKWEDCGVRSYCGVGLDAEGWSMCGKAVMMGKLLGIDPSMKEGNIKKHVKTPIEDICKHCQYGLKGKKIKRQIHQNWLDGKYDNVSPGGVSETWEQAFAQFGEDKEPLVQLEVF